VITRLLSVFDLGGELALERVDDRAEAFGIHAPIVASLKLANIGL